MPHVYTENPEETRVIVGSMNMGYGSDTARNRTHNLFRPKCAPIPGDSDGLLVPMRPRWWNRRHLIIGTDVIQPADVVRDLGIFFSSHLTMKLYEARVDRTCFYHLCRQQSIRHSLGLTSPHGLFPPSWSRGWITATRFWHIYRLQRVVDAAARMFVNLRPRDHGTSVLHFLPIAERIEFKRSLLVHHVIFGRAPSYLTELVTSVADVPARASLRSAGRSDLVVQRSRLVSFERFLLRHQELGTVCPLTLYW